jgi:phage terminase large subunit
MSDEAIARERRELTAERGEDEAENIINQEYYCSFDAAIPGSYYGKIIAKLEAQGRICDVPHDPRLPVFTAWDLGVGDSTAIWFAQQTRAGAVRIIDYYENSGVGADHYARIVSERGYNYEGHYLPHDADDREWGQQRHITGRNPEIAQGAPDAGAAKGECRRRGQRRAGASAALLIRRGQV